MEQPVLPGHGPLATRQQGRGPQWYDRAVEWMDAKAANERDLIRFRAEAAELLGVNEKKDSTNLLPVRDRRRSTNFGEIILSACLAFASPRIIRVIDPSDRAVFAAPGDLRGDERMRSRRFAFLAILLCTSAAASRLCRRQPHAPGRPARRRIPQRSQRRQRRWLDGRRLQRTWRRSRSLPLDERRRHGRPGRPVRRRLRKLRADGVSGDGSVVVGYGNSGTRRAAKRSAGRAPAAWSAWATCRGDFGLAPAYGVSGDGSVVVGEKRLRLRHRGLPLDERRRHGRPRRPARRRLQ